MFAYALAIFVGAFLLFQVQPLIGKYILPWFGGGPGVWTTCMLFFQTVLLAGYAYAHLLSRWFRPRAQVVIHLVLLTAAVLLLPITPADAWKPTGNEDPILRILGLLLASIGLPYFILSSTGPLMQHWFSLARPGASPYRLYALSNVGSLLALVSYPFFFEARLTRKYQAECWGWGLVLFLVAAAACGVSLWRKAGALSNPGEATKADSVADPAHAGGEHSSRRALQATEDVTPWQRLAWLLLPACASVLLLATTNKICLDVAVIPFLWVVPLAVYLLTFIIAFDSPRWYHRFPYAILLAASLVGVAWALNKGPDWPVLTQVAVYGTALFVFCMVCHGELYRLRPAPRFLTGFYLMIATGGAAGGLLVAVVAPKAFSDYYELHWGLVLCGLLFLLVCLADAPTCRARREECSPETAASTVASAGPPTQTPGERTYWRWLAWMLPALIIWASDRVFVRLAADMNWASVKHLLPWRVLVMVAAGLAAILFLVRGAVRNPQVWRRQFCGWFAFGLALLATNLWLQVRKSSDTVVLTSRNFYGVLAVYDNAKGDPDNEHRVFLHGRITHGLQFRDPVQSEWATSYFGPETGIGVTFRSLSEGPRRLGILGLGAGTLATYGRKGDYIRFYEINPQVVQIAQTEFTYLSNSAAKVEVVMGDARLSMEKEPPQGFDLLVMDAFSSDSVPVHLLTRECFELYQRHVKTNGVLVVNISNHYVDLEPVVVNLAKHFGYHFVKCDYEEREDAWWVYANTWMLLSRDEAFLKKPLIAGAAVSRKTNRTDVPLWTDDFASLFQILW